MRVLFVSHNFPPEVNALARRTYEHAREWSRRGGQVEVLTDVPHFPEGRVYAGFENRLVREDVDGIEVLRVPLLPLENRGAVRRALNYVSFMESAVWHSRRLRRRPDVVVASSPQFFTAIAGWRISRRLGVPFVMEVRDLWPESAVATGVVSRNPVVRFFERVERFLYEKAAHLVVVTDSFRDHLRGLGVPASKITVLKNGVYPERFAEGSMNGEPLRLRRAHGLNGEFVASYIGTVGTAHGADVLLEAARRCPDPEVVFMVVGTGAARARLEEGQRRLGLPNFRLVDKQPHERIPAYYRLSDASVVHLRDLPLFRTVIPSKLFEAMASERPVVLGVEGESRRILERARAGIAVPPESPDALLDAVLRLKRGRTVRRELGRNGREYVARHHDRRHLARRYWSLLERVAVDES